MGTRFVVLVSNVGSSIIPSVLVVSPNCTDESCMNPIPSIVSSPSLASCVKRMKMKHIKVCPSMPIFIQCLSYYCIDLSLVVPEQYGKEWRQEPESDLSLQYPYPTKSSEQSATCDSEVTHVTSLEIRQGKSQQQMDTYQVLMAELAQETHARFEPIEEQQRKKNKTISLDSPTIAVSSRINDVRVVRIDKVYTMIHSNALL